VNHLLWSNPNGIAKADGQPGYVAAQKCRTGSAPKAALPQKTLNLFPNFLVL